MTEIYPGCPYPLGATVEPDGVNFTVYSSSAESLELCLYDAVDDPKPSRVVPLDPRRHRTYHYWHAFIEGLAPGSLYGFRARGPYDPAAGLRFDPDKLLLDPYARAVATPDAYNRAAVCLPGANDAIAMKSVVVDVGEFDWEGDTPLRRPFSETIIYELHVRGFTRHPSSGVKKRKRKKRKTRNLRGTFAGLIEKIPYLQDLGITAVELLPVFQFDPQDAPDGLTNYWGYSPISFFAPHAGYSSRRDALGPINEFRRMVKALHRAGIEVILDVVYNHTSEGDGRGPTQSFRGLDNSTYYMLGQEGEYSNYSGTGNTLNANHAVVRRLIVDSLRYWVEVMHVDGFRFDLASILARDETGRPVPNPPVLFDIETEPVLAGTKLIAEAWDAAGLYQVGDFVGDSWKEWNGKFRDDVRSFMRGDRGSVSQIAHRIMGSPDLYGARPREPEQSINFVTCHDGFTLNDLVTYEEKRNEANLEDGRDGSDDNRAWNCGIEGPTDDPVVERLRNRQIKNFLTVTMLSVGTPMLLMGDEMRRTQLGNNNVYCQDNEMSWMDWSLLERHADVHRFVQGLIEIRKHFDTVKFDHGLTLNEVIQQAKIRLHGTRLGAPDLSDHSHSLAVSAVNRSNGLRMHFILNAYEAPLTFEVPALPGDYGPWRRVIDTSLPSPEDVSDQATAPAVSRPFYPVAAHSVAVLFAARNGEA